MKTIPNAAELKQFEADISKFKIEDKRNSTSGLASINVEAAAKSIILLAPKKNEVLFSAGL